MKIKAFVILPAALVLAALTFPQQAADINGAWKSNIGKTYDIRQTGSSFTWKTAGGDQTANGTINGLELSAAWVEGPQRGSATGVIVLDPQRRAVRIEWSNGVVFTRSEGRSEGDAPPPPGDIRPPVNDRPPLDRPRGDRPPQEGPIRLGGAWHGNNGLIYEFFQQGLNFNWQASNGAKGGGALAEEMKIRSSFPDQRSVSGRIFLGEEPGMAVVIEWDNGLVLTRDPQPEGERRKPGEPEQPGIKERDRPRPEERDRPIFFDLSGIWFGPDPVEAEVGQEGPEFVWREMRTKKTYRGRIEGERLWRTEEGREGQPMEGRIVEADGRRAVRLQWGDGTVFTRQAGPGPELAMVKAQEIPPPGQEFKLIEAHLMKAKVYNTWVKMGGPLGGLGYDVRFSANTEKGKSVMYVTDNYSGVNRSKDGGATWSAANTGITGRAGPSVDAIPVFCLTVDPNNPQIVWAGLKDVSGAYKSTDGGEHWTEVSPEGEEAFVFRGFTIMPGKSNIVFAMGEIPMNVKGKTFDKTRGRVYKTEDGGQSWRIIWQGENLTRYVIVHPQNPDIIYVSTGIFDREANNSNCTNSILNTTDLTGSYAFRGGVGILKSENGGRTWRVLGRDHGLSDLYVGTLVMHPTDPNILLAGCGNNSASHYYDNGKSIGLGGVFLTTNGGKTWMKTLASETITAVDFAWSDPRIAYAGGQHGFYRSEDGGESWKPINGSIGKPWGPPGVVSGFPIDILVDPTNPNILFVNNYGGGNVKSADGGKSWTVASKGYTGALMYDVDINPKNPDIVYTGARSGAFRSLDGGHNWEGLSYALAAFTECYSIALHPANSQIVLASREQLGTLYRSQNGGKTWTVVYQLPVTPGEPTKEYGFKCIVYAPSNHQVVYAGSACPMTILDEYKTAGLGVFKSTDGGVSWAEANNSITKNLSINNLAVHPQNENIVYAATSTGGLCKTTDGGKNWVRLNGIQLADVRAVAIRPDKPDQVYAGLNLGGVYFSANGGSTWAAMPTGMEGNDRIFALVIDPTYPDVIWAGSNRAGVYRRDPIEQRWMKFNPGLRTRAVTDLAISASGKVLYATTWGEGVFRLDLKPAGSK